MNVADSEVVVSVMKDHGYTRTDDMHEADVILVNTCSIRENAETRVWGRLDVFKQIRKKNPELIVGVIGCMAERLKQELIEEAKIVDLVVGPDAYRELPSMLVEVEQGKKAINVKLSKEENYEDILPVRYDTNGVSAFVSIMRGCDNMCAFCVVPFTRGRERSRSPQTILREVQELIDNNYKEVTLLGQNVDKYAWTDETGSLSFAGLLEKVALKSPLLRVRFSTSYPQDMTDEVLEIMAKYDNICKSIHLPVQSGSTKMLELMKRGYTREWYMERISAIKKYLPDCSISTDIIAGFCDETEEDHRETLSLMEWVKYDFAFMFKYSERPNTFAARKYKDNVAEEIKTRRLNEIIALQNKLSAESKKQDIGKIYEVLIEGTSKKSKEYLFGRNSQNKVIVFPKEDATIGDYVNVKILRSTSATLIGEILNS